MHNFNYILFPLATYSLAHINNTFQPDDEGYGELDLLAGSNDAIGYRGTVHYSTKYVHQYRLHLNKEI